MSGGRLIDDQASNDVSWRLRGGPATHWEPIAAATGCPDVIASLLVSRGIADGQTAKSFFEPKIDNLHDPRLLLGMTQAVERIQNAVAEGEPILIYGDYDVDGTTAIVLLKTAIERIAPKDKPAKVTYHVPHRIREGYGMQVNVLGDAAFAGIRLVISVDTGIRAFAAAAEAKALGLDLIVTDHHLPDGAAGVPEALAVINPAQADCSYPFKMLCGAAVGFKLAHALMDADARTEQARTRLQEVLLPSFLKLVAMATIADSVPLVGENRVIAALGLQALRNPVQAGLRALMEVAEIPLDRSPTATEVGFRLAPRINAAGRMDVASDVVELFLTKDSTRAGDLARKLDRLNAERRTTEAQALEAIEQRLATIKSDTGTFPAECLILDDEDWHRGVLGILASRVVDRTGRPTLVLTSEDGQAHGSGRSVEGFHLLDALTAVHGCDGGAEKLFTRFGGHAHAVGFSLPSSNIDLLRDRMRRYTSRVLNAPMLACRLDYDQEIKLSEITPELYGWLMRCAPFGNGHPEPVFISVGVELLEDPRVIKEKHVCLQFAREQGGLSALGWSRTIDWVRRCEEMMLRAGSKVDIAYRVRMNTHAQFGGIELELADMRLPQAQKP